MVVGLISLGGGLPSSDYFPFEHIEVRVPTVGQFSEEETRIAGQNVKIGKYDVLEGNSTYDLAIALNYGQGTGSAQLLRFVTEHTEVRAFLEFFSMRLRRAERWDGMGRSFITRRIRIGNALSMWEVPLHWACCIACSVSVGTT